MSEHAKLSPSAAKRWMACPGSVEAAEAALELLGGDQSSPAAREGTRAHSVAETLLRGKEPPHNTPHDMLAYGKGYEAFCRGLMLTAVAHGIEARVDVSKWIPDGFGTVDFWALSNDGRLHVVDYKYGRGIRVPVINNPQLRIYALGVIAQLDNPEAVKSVTTVIYQPRQREPIVRGVTVEASELLTWADEVLRPAASATTAPFAERIPGEEQCIWCPARGSCGALADWMDRRVLRAFASETSDGTMSLTVMGEVLQNEPTVKSWLVSVRKSAIAHAQHGAKIPGMKLVTKRGRRKWSENAAKGLEKILGTMAYRPAEPQLVTISRARELGVPLSIINELVEQSESVDLVEAGDGE